MNFGGSVHDVIGTRCDPYTTAFIRGQYHQLLPFQTMIRALADIRVYPSAEAEPFCA